MAQEQHNSPEDSVGDTEDEQSNRPQSSQDNSYMPLLNEERLRRKLKFFFMNPIEKWQARQRFPYKFVVQLIKIILVTIQICLFAFSRYDHVNYTWDNRITFSHLFLKGWDPTREVNVYPPGAGPLAIYKQQDFFDTIDYAYWGYKNLSAAIGPYSYANEDNTMPNMELCVYRYKEGEIFGFNESYVFDAEVVEACQNISNYHENFQSKLYFESLNISFSALVKATLSFPIKTINFKAAGRITPPNCYQFNVIIIFDNEDHDGQMLLSLDAEPTRLMCRGDVEYITDSELDAFLRSLLNYLVIIVCVISLVLCSRAVWRAQQLKKFTNNFFIRQYRKPMTQHDQLKFLNLWYITIIVNDVLIIVGSAIKEQIERRDFTSDQWNVCSVFLGTGNLLVWFGVLRYLGFFKTYNVVILTLKKASPKVMRFLLCAMLIYAGFTFCGWLILGPYHLKFRSLSTTSECLFSLINGDDMFATFSIMSRKSAVLWWYSRIYLYSFISLYIYVILSLFISVIMDAYDTIKLYYKEGFPKSDLEAFIGELTIDDVSNGILRSRSNDCLKEIVQDLCCCSHIKQSISSLNDSRTTLKNNECRPEGMPV